MIVALGTGPLTTTEVGERLGLSTKAITRPLQDLEAHGLVSREAGGRGNAYGCKCYFKRSELDAWREHGGSRGMG